MTRSLQNTRTEPRTDSMHAQAQKQRPLKDIFRVPLLLALLSTLGLISALVGDGIFDWFSWLALGIPVAVILRYGKGQ